MVSIFTDDNDDVDTALSCRRPHNFFRINQLNVTLKKDTSILEQFWFSNRKA